MAYTLKFEHPQFPDDYEFGFPYLGVVKNNSTMEIDEDTERGFIAARGVSVEDAFKENSMVTLSGSSNISADELKSLLPVEEVNESPDSASDSSASNSTLPGAPVEDKEEVGEDA